MLVERGDQLAQLKDLFVWAANGKGSVAVVAGAPGTGKTTLLRTFAEHAAAEGAVVLGATASHAERNLPLGVTDQLMDDRPDRAAGWPASTRPDDIRRAWAGLLELSGRRPVLIWIDDAPYVDRPSATTLLYWARRIAHRGVLFLVAEPGAAYRTEGGLCAELRRLPHAHAIGLPLLSGSGVRELCQDRFGQADADQLAADCAEFTGGNPALVHAMLDGIGARGAERGPVAGDAFARAVTDHLRQCDQTVREVVLGMAILGDATTPSRLRQLCRTDIGSVSHALAALHEGGLLEHGRFRHPATASTVLGVLAPARRSDLRLAAAELLYQNGAEAIAVAEHLLATAEVHKPWAASVLEEAASRTMDRDETEFAVACLKLASALCDDEAQRAVIVTRLALAEWRTDPLKAADYHPQLFNALRQGRLRGRQLAAFVESLLWYGRFDDAASALEGVTDESTGLDGETVAELREARDRLSHTYPTVLDRLRTEPWHGLPVVPAMMTLTTGVNAMLATVMMHGGDPETVSRAEHLLADVRLDDTTVDTVKIALVTLLTAGQVSRAAVWCDRFLAEAARRQAPTWQAFLTGIKSDILMRQGDLRSARKCARSALTFISPGAWGVAVVTPLALLVLAATRMGRLEEAGRELRRPVPDVAFHTRFGLYYLHARGHYLLATDQLDAAIREFTRCGELMDSWGIDAPGLIAWRIGAAEAYLRRGDRQRAHELVLGQLDCPGVRGTRVGGMALRMLAATSEPARRAALLRDALAVLRGCGDHYETCLALVDLAQVQRGAGAHDQARLTTREAMGLAKICHAEPIARALRETDQAVASPRRSPENDLAGWALTDAELRVAGLAAVGRTNRQIGGELGITVSTVEQHLTSVYRKLKVRGRVGLSRSGVLRQAAVASSSDTT
ncbi:MAG TPA: AAA family ATPase [Pseudonocardiaceae bacterium]|nr:AAA family ATPase [Pseudonocardiaceae bacterium]